MFFLFWQPEQYFLTYSPKSALLELFYNACTRLEKLQLKQIIIFFFLSKIFHKSP